jgi:hypothetical protein
MRKLGFLTGAAVSALFLTAALPASAQSSTDRARIAIGEAHAKIDAAVKVGATGETPRLLAEAQASLRSAEEELHRSHEKVAIDQAHHASLLADQALGVAQKNKDDAAAAERDARVNAEANVAVATQQRDAAENSAVNAQQQAAAANDRAADAQQAASNAAAEAQAARLAAATPPTTTVTVERETTPARTYSVKKPVKKVVRKTTTVKKTVPATTKTTTTVTTAPSQ